MRSWDQTSPLNVVEMIVLRGFCHNTTVYRHFFSPKYFNRPHVVLWTDSDVIALYYNSMRLSLELTVAERKLQRVNLTSQFRGNPGKTYF